MRLHGHVFAGETHGAVEERVFLLLPNRRNTPKADRMVLASECQLMGIKSYMHIGNAIKEDPGLLENESKHILRHGKTVGKLKKVSFTL